MKLVVHNSGFGYPNQELGTFHQLPPMILIVLHMIYSTAAYVAVLHVERRALVSEFH
jgi:hypothetical protein